MSTATASSSFPQKPGHAAKLYIELGLSPTSSPPRSKHPDYEGWQQPRIKLDNLERYFPTGVDRNVGNLNGGYSSNHHDVDLDCPEGRAAAALLLPPTGWRFGRKTAPESHWIYRTERPFEGAQLKYLDTDDSVLVELRGTGGHTIYPPSTHQGTGERIVWHEFTEPARVGLDDLRRAVREVAAVALLARHWPKKPEPGEHSCRHDAYMHLAGGLLREGFDKERLDRIFRALVAVTNDEELDDRLAVIPYTAEKLERDEKVTGFPRLAKLIGEHGDRVAEKLREWFGVKLRFGSGDAPIPEPLPWPDPPGEEAFHGLAGDIVRAIEPVSEADRTALLVQILVGFGNIIGRAAYFEVESDRHHGNEFAVLVGKTSKARKGTSWGRTRRLLREAEALWESERVQSGLSSGEGLIWAVRDPIPKRERVKERGQPVRYEEVEADPGISDKRLLVLEPEYASVLKQTERQGNTLSPILRHAWDGLDLRTLTKNSPARATGAHISLIGHITTDEVRRYLTETEMANGYGNRNLWFCTDRSKLLPEGGYVDAKVWENLCDRLTKALTFARSAGEVTRDEDARVLWREVYATLSEGKPGLAGALLARGEAHVMRLAMLYALLDSSAVISACHLLAAMALWDYAERSVYFIFGDCLGDPIADDLLRVLRSSPEGLTRNDMMDYFRRNHSSARIGQALGLLLQHKLVRLERRDTGGRPAERWFATAHSRQG
jgi:hypothetical protein